MKKILLLCNSSAGQGNARRDLFKVVMELTALNSEVTVFPIVPDRNLLSIDALKDAKDKYDLIVCMGGDGTLNHLINEMINLNLDLPIGYIPTGSANDFAKNIGIDGDVEEVCNGIVNGHIFNYDVGKLNDLYFNYVAAFGAFTNVSYATDQNMKNALGYAAYVLQTIALIPEALRFSSHMAIEYDGNKVEDDFILGVISNSISVAGVTPPFLQQAQLDDGIFEGLLIKTPKTITELNETIMILASGNTDDKHVFSFSAKEMTLAFDQKVSWTIDGESGGETSYAKIEVIPKKIKMMVGGK